jgi:hypothetical protein
MRRKLFPEDVFVDCFSQAPAPTISMDNPLEETRKLADSAPASVTCKMLRCELRSFLIAIQIQGIAIQRTINNIIFLSVQLTVRDYPGSANVYALPRSLVELARFWATGQSRRCEAFSARRGFSRT